MSQIKRTAEQIATAVFKALPHIDKVWVNVDAQTFDLSLRYASEGAVVVRREDIIKPIN